MKLTTNYGLKKPDASDIVNIDDFNYNADAIDSVIKTVEEVVSANKTSIQSANNNISTLQSAVSSLQNELSTNKSTLQNNINAIREVL